MIDFLDRIGFVFLVLLLVVGAPYLASKGYANRITECRSIGGQVIVQNNRPPACILP